MDLDRLHVPARSQRDTTTATHRHPLVGAVRCGEHVLNSLPPRFHTCPWFRCFSTTCIHPGSYAQVDESYALCDSEDYREGLRAFLAREKPAFRGR